MSRAGELIRDAELSKARIYDVKGRSLPITVENSGLTPENVKEFNVTYHSTLLDEDYLLVGSYVDDVTRRKIGNGEYVDFAKLMPKDKLTGEEDQRMEMVNRGGLTYWLPVSDQEVTSISSYIKWEQAFRVFSNIYTDFHPHKKSSELIQYNHIIHTAS